MSLLLKREGGGSFVRLPADAAALLCKKYPNDVSVVHVASSHNVGLCVIASSDALLLGQSEVGGPLVPQTELRTSTHSWHPSTAPAKADHVVFIGQPLLNGEQFPFQLTAPTAEAKAEQRKVDFDKKQAQLTVALASNKRAFEDAKENGELSDVGALAIERDRIEQDDNVWIAPLSIQLPVGAFRHPETRLLWQLSKLLGVENSFERVGPIMVVNNEQWRV